MTLGVTPPDRIPPDLAGRLGLGLLFLLALLTGWGVYRVWFAVDISAAMDRAVREQQRPTLRIADLTPFEWNQLYLYSGYDFKEDICADLSLTWMECVRIPSDAGHDGITRFVFLHRDRLVHSQEHYGSGIESHPTRPLTPDTAVFLVEREEAFFNDFPRVVLRRVRPASNP